MLRTGEIFAGYVIKRVLGQGGMGTVYLAQHPRLPRMTALKLLDRELYGDVEIRGRFEREADLVAQLDHPNIVTVYDRGAEDEQLWISMQFVAGSDAASADVDVLAAGRAVQIIAETAAALDFAHANGVLHRDVKPANILLAKAPIGQPERVLLTDFGIAGMRNADTTLSSAGTITATLAYAAPEQLSGLTLDHRADQYSLACTLFWMLTGNVPFPGSTPAAVMNGHMYTPVPPLSRTRRGLPPALDAVMARALAKRPADRFPSCTDFATAARRALASGPRGPHPMTGPIPPHTGFATHPGVPLRTGYVPDGRPPNAGAPHPGAPTHSGAPVGSQPYTGGPTHTGSPAHPQTGSSPHPGSRAHAGAHPHPGVPRTGFVPPANGAQPHSPHASDPSHPGVSAQSGGVVPTTGFGPPPNGAPRAARPPHGADPSHPGVPAQS
ncbi:serine/threonine-protein kinase, partial [Nocardia amikacinitolerans]|uniref:serine/threonine-protein kinase n=1 Tax=Nocardia amikacinitolerans TaxID=756689 RepID=UPI0020A5B873